MDHRTIHMKAARPAHFDDGPSADATTREIEDSIRAVRSRLDQTLDELQYRLSPRYLSEQAVKTMKERSQKIGESVVNTIRENPIPSALIGLGVAWFAGSMIRQRVAAGDGRSRRGHRWTDSARKRTAELAGTAKERASEFGHELTSKAADVAHTVREKSGEIAHGAQEKVAATAREIRERAGEIADRATRAAREVGERARETYEMHPLAVGLGIFAAGLAAGLCMPTTRQEDEIMGPERDRLMERARRKGDELIQRGKRAAESAMDAAAREASESMEEVNRRSREVTRAAREAARQEA